MSELSFEEKQRNALRVHQSRYDEALRAVGARAREPVLGETELQYRTEMCRDMKKTYLPRDHKLYGVNWRGIKSDAVLNAMEPDLLKAVQVEAWNPAHVEPGKLVERKITDHFGKVTEIRFVGPESFVKQFGRPGRRVLSINTDQGRWDPRTGGWF
jgi:hypothetical protein